MRNKKRGDSSRMRNLICTVSYRTTGGKDYRHQETGFGACRVPEQNFPFGISQSEVILMSF